ncbi:MAG TPA: bacteriohopanetetrol glucosamine biosynthesis glycosyltransferase HpnI [Caulobacteraceae bacterium]|jgi:ceramide glucosyltransferase
MSLILSIAGALVLLMATAGAVFGVVAAVSMGGFLGRAATPPRRRPAVTILRPMKGLDPEADANLLSLVEQDYRGSVRIVLGADSEADPAIAAARRLQAERPGHDIVVIADPTQHGTNRKLSNLINMAPHVTGEIVVISDSDVRLPPDGLSALVGALEPEGAGLAYALYRGRPTGNLWSRLAALDINARFAGSVVMGQALKAHPVLGPTMAVKARALAGAGGFERLKDVLADDFELGRMVREQGLSIACPPMLIDHGFPERSLAELWRHELRWARTIRLLNPGGYGGSLITYVVPLALIGAALTSFHPYAMIALGVLAGARLTFGLLSCLLMQADTGVLWLFAVRDVLAFAVFLAAFFGDGVEWRGARLRVKPDGAMASS